MIPDYIQKLRQVGQNFRDRDQPGDTFLLRGKDTRGNSILYRTQIIEKHAETRYDPPLLNEMTHTEGPDGIVSVRLNPLTHLVESVTTYYSGDRRQQQHLAIRDDGMILAEACAENKWRDLTKDEARALYDVGLESATNAVQVVGLQALLGDRITVVPQAYQKEFEVAKQFER